MKFQKGLSSLVLTIIHALFLLKDEFVDSAVTSKLLLLFFMPLVGQVFSLELKSTLLKFK